MDIENFVHHAATPGYVFFERSVLDAHCGFDSRCTPERERVEHVALDVPILLQGLHLAPWKAIYENDDERDHTFEHAESVYGIVKEWYSRLDRYQVVEVPKVSVGERCMYVLRELANLPNLLC